MVMVETGEEDARLALQLQRLRESLLAMIESNASHGSLYAGQNQLLDAARGYNTILREAASLTNVPDFSGVICQALRLFSLFLTVDNHVTNDNATAAMMGMGTSFSEFSVDGIEQLITLLPIRQPLRQSLREELLKVVRLLLSPVAQEESQAGAASPLRSVSLYTSVEIENTSRSQVVDVNRRLLCSRLLLERGLCCCRYVEELFSSSCVNGMMLKRFLLHTLKEEFTRMHAHANSLLSSLDDTTYDTKYQTESNHSDPGHFYYYACLSAQANNSSALCGRSAATALNFSTGGYTTPLFRPNGEDRNWQPRGGAGGGRCNNIIQRIVSKKSAAVLWSLATLASLGRGMPCERETTPQDHHDKTSDFVDFIGDLVSVCAVVVRPFLTEQLELLEHVFQGMSLFPTNQQDLGTLQLHVNEDVTRYHRYKNVVDEFLRFWDPSFSRVSPSPAMMMTHGEPLPASTEREKEEKEEKVPGRSALRTGPETEEKAASQWEPVAPPLAAYLASSSSAIPSDGEVSWADAMALFAEVKRFREKEREKLWGQWMRLRSRTCGMARDVVRMRQRLNSLQETKAILSSLNVTSVHDFQTQWENRIHQRVRNLQEALQNVQEKQ